MRNYVLVAIVLIRTFFSMAQETLPHIISVTGEGTVKVVPDEATITVRVENDGNNALDVKSENDSAIAKVLAFAKKSGISDKDIQTQYVNLNKNYDYNKKTYQYKANQTVRLKVRKLDNFDIMMSGLLDAGINRVDGVQFMSSRESALKSEARKKAVADAKMKAEEYTKELNQKVGKAIQIQEQVTSSPYPSPVLRNSMKMYAMSESNSPEPTIAPGELTIKSTIHITFDLD